MKLVFKYLKHHKWLFLLNVFAVLAVAAAEIGIPLVISTLVDKGMRVIEIINGTEVVTQNFNVINKAIIILFIVGIIGALGNLLLNFSSSKTSTAIIKEMRVDIFRKVQSFSPAEYNKFGISSLITRSTSDVFQIMQFINMFFRTVLLAPILIILSIALSAFRAPQLLIITAVTIPIIIVIMIFVAARSKPISQKQQIGLDTLNRISRENLTGVRVIRAFRKSGYEQERFEKTNQEYTTHSMKLFKLMNYSEPIFFFVLNLSTVAIIVFGSALLSNSVSFGGGTFSLGKLIEFIDYQFHIMFSILMVAIVFMMYPRTRVSASRISAIFETTPMITSDKSAQPLTRSPRRVDFVNVFFQYPDGANPVLKDISFSAKQGEKIAFIGSTGSGKSTLIQLLPRFYDVTSGKILIDEVDIRKYQLDSLRSHIGYIAQKSLLFSGTIEDNIKYGKGDASEYEIEKASKIAQAKDFIESKPNQYQDLISESGSNMSGGQKQRLSIARAVVREPGIYIFDDSFSALDYKTDAMLRKALETVADTSIMFIVAQRISSIIDADKIIVLDEGQVVGKGTHKELLKTCAIYYEIAKSQLPEEELR